MSDTGTLADAVLKKLLDTVGAAGCDDHFSMDIWEWPQGVALHGLLSRYEAEGREEDLAALRSWYKRRIAAGLPSRNVNTVAPFLALAELARREGNREWLGLCEDWAEWIMREMPRTEEGGLQHITAVSINEGELWADTLFMTVLFLARAGKILGRREYLDEAEYQFLLHIKYLADPASGLWSHGWKFGPRHRYGGVHWARGNAWFTAGAVEFIEIAQPSAPVRRAIVEALASQARALLNVQDASGLWHTILDDPSSYLETSASSAIAYGLHKAARLGLLGEGGAAREARSASLRAAAGVVSRIAADGTVSGVSHGTAIGMDAEHYKSIRVTSTAYGQGLAFLMLSELSGEDIDGLR
jgi:Predicted unsaturated glucuronyl hydrolase involved in regulation of bacterial surface properties, and related proteins